MEIVLWCAGIMGGLGVLFGIGLAIASRAFHVETDPRIEQVQEALPGIDCGACGYAGCSAYAEAVVNGESPDLCKPGGHETALNLAHIMGAHLADERQEVRAIIKCQGGTDRCAQRFVYEGVEDCRAAHLIQGGPKACEYGCLGYGTCAQVCPFDAIIMGPDRIPVVDWDKCTGCGACVKVCPRNLCETIPTTAGHYVACSSQDKGKAVRQACKVGCISCWLCVKVSEEGTIEKNGNLPRLTWSENADYSAAMEKCPMNCFVKIEPPIVGHRQPEEEPAEAAS